jgi:hypothetical protein
VLLLDGAGRREDAVDEALHVEEDRIVAALTGWMHPDATRACEAAGGRLVSAAGSSLGWMVSFSLGRRIRKGM